MRRLRTFHLYAALVALTVVVYLPLWKNDFIDLDDKSYLTTNPHVTEGLTWPGFTWAWTNSLARSWQPVTWLSLQLDAQLFSGQTPEGQPQLSPAAFHGQNLFWHTLSVLLVFTLWRRLTRAVWPSFLVAVLFAVHPMRVESVAWAAERKDVLSVFFGLLTVWGYVRYLKHPSWGRYLGMMAAFLLSLLSKPMLITLPFVLLLLDYWPLRRLGSAPGRRGAPVSLVRLILEKTPLFLLAATIAVVTTVFREKTGSAVALSELSLTARLMNALTAYGWYVFTSFWPTGLAILYPHLGAKWSVPAVLAGATLLVGITLLSLWQVRRRPWLLVGWLWFVGTLFPVIGLAQGGSQAWADRFTYWPHIGLFVVVVWGLKELSDRVHLPTPARSGAVVLAVGTLALLTWIQLGYWRDTPTLWERALAVTKDNHRAHWQLGIECAARGRLHDAERHFTTSVQLRPRSPTYRYYLGLTLFSLEKVEQAAVQFEKVLEGDPRFVGAWHGLGRARLSQGKAEAAARCFRKVLALHPGNSDALAGLGQSLWQMGKRQQALVALEAALHLNPQEAGALHGLGRAHLDCGRREEALAALRKAVELQPRRIESQSDLGVALCRCGRWAEGCSCHVSALRLQEAKEQFLWKGSGEAPRPDSAATAVLVRCRLAFTLKQLGDERAAAEIYRKALKLAPNWPREFTARAWTLATGGARDVGDLQLAYELTCQAAQAVADPPASILDTLAVTQAALGQFQDAVRTAEQALVRASKAGETALARGIRQRLQLYSRGQAVTVRHSGDEP
jgi:tetratricopeptide (TPR) repeat protein